MWQYKKVVVRAEVVVWKTGQQVGEANTLVSVSSDMMNLAIKAGSITNHSQLSSEPPWHLLQVRATVMRGTRFF